MPRAVADTQFHTATTGSIKLLNTKGFLETSTVTPYLVHPLDINYDSPLLDMVIKILIVTSFGSC